MPDYQTARLKIDAIEAEMKRTGMWSAEPPPPEAFEFRAAFAMDTMPFVHWLQFVFIPRVRQIIATGGDFPASSQVGAQAVREFDGINEASELVSLLSDFDYFIRSG
ncbi:MAG: YqcC family protein [Chloroflexota bacterium]|nr:YqcC family protein [Chloroflexota bacterium]MDQ5864160.1 YqcC family protein [Chloroflexota bacterium]